ncbi:DUF6064 family protein [Yoonia sp.]|uniref:DUF6064 family protein n=1 Tax=Yoonia sp. TaxID=2212373 RepID=UPI0025F2707F|nr:DUF6064 family protein [Yoonia sp.]
MPFSRDQFFAVFAQYNAEMWPMPIAGYVIGLLAVGLLFWESRASAIMIPTLLAALWIANGAGYHAIYFAQINPLGPVFATLFLGVSPLVYGDMNFRLRRDARTVVALGLVGFAMVIYPLWGVLVGHLYPAVPVFGSAPCPTTIFTIGILLLADWTAARWLMVVPGIWAMIGGSAAILLGVPQDWGLLVALAMIVVFAIGRLRDAAFARH